MPLNGRRVVACHDHSGQGVIDGLVEAIAGGVSVVYVSEAGTPLVSDPGFTLARAVVGVTGRRPAVGGVPFGTDAGPLGRSGLPCVVFGPGDIAQAHTKDEWVELDQVRAAAEIYFRMALQLG